MGPHFFCPDKQKGASDVSSDGGLKTIIIHWLSLRKSRSILQISQSEGNRGPLFDKITNNILVQILANNLHQIRFFFIFHPFDFRIAAEPGDLFLRILPGVILDIGNGLR